ncbi:hypothetical protein D3C87_2140790 [compost metagenome]
MSLGLEISRPFDHKTVDAYATALAADFAWRAPHLTDAFVETAEAIVGATAAL